MSYTDQLLKSICDKMDLLIENQRQIERRLASLEQAAGKKRRVIARKKASGIKTADPSENRG